VLAGQKANNESELASATETVTLVKFEEHHKHPHA